MSEIPEPKPPYETLPADGDVEFRALKPEDASVVFETVNANREYLAQFLPWVEFTKAQIHSSDFISETAEKRKKGTEYGFGVYSNNRFAGHASLMHVEDNQSPEIGYWTAEEFFGKGLATAATKALTEFGVQTLGIETIIIRADPNNIGSNRVAENAGYKFKGQTRDEEIMGKLTNTWVYRI